MNTTDAKEHWEQHYGERDRVWSGRVNVRLAEVVSPLEAGSALDLGNGEGADACWLAERRWTVVAVDISDTALQRATAAAGVLHVIRVLRRRPARQLHTHCPGAAAEVDHLTMNAWAEQDRSRT